MGTRAKREYNWDYIRSLFVNGMTIRRIAEMEDMPAARTIEARSAAENWVHAREVLYRQERAKEKRELRKRQQDAIEQQYKLGRLLQSLSVRALSEKDPEEISTLDAVRLGRLGTELVNKSVFGVSFADLGSAADSLETLLDDETLLK